MYSGCLAQCSNLKLCFSNTPFVMHATITANFSHVSLSPRHQKQKYDSHVAYYIPKYASTILSLQFTPCSGSCYIIHRTISLCSGRCYIIYRTISPCSGSCYIIYRTISPCSGICYIIYRTISPCCYIS